MNRADAEERREILEVVLRGAAASRVPRARPRRAVGGRAARAARGDPRAALRRGRRHVGDAGCPHQPRRARRRERASRQARDPSSARGAPGAARRWSKASRGASQRASTSEGRPSARAFDADVTRALVEARSRQRRAVFGSEHVRGLFTDGAKGEEVPVYIASASAPPSSRASLASTCAWSPSFTPPSTPMRASGAACASSRSRSSGWTDERRRLAPGDVASPYRGRSSASGPGLPRGDAPRPGQAARASRSSRRPRRCRPRARGVQGGRRTPLSDVRPHPPRRRRRRTQHRGHRGHRRASVRSCREAPGDDRGGPPFRARGPGTSGRDSTAPTSCSRCPSSSRRPIRSTRTQRGSAPRSRGRAAGAPRRSPGDAGAARAHRESPLRHEGHVWRAAHPARALGDRVGGARASGSWAASRRAPPPTCPSLRGSWRGRWSKCTRTREQTRSAWRCESSRSVG
jgi:hypothetical protein